MNKILSNETIFKQIDHDETLKKLKQFQGFLNILRKNKYLDEKAYQFIRPTAAVTPTLYGLPKLHKENIPMRPILASKDSFNYQPAVWLNNILTSLREHSSVFKDTFGFVKLSLKIQQLNQNFL